MEFKRIIIIHHIHRVFHFVYVVARQVLKDVVCNEDDMMIMGKRLNVEYGVILFATRYIQMNFIVSCLQGKWSFCVT